MIMGAFKTRERLAKMKKVKTDNCLACNMNESETLPHLLRTKIGSNEPTHFPVSG
jgi:hypothetical protein